MRVETREERLERRRRERAEQVAYKLEQEIAVWDPAGIPNVTADPFKTLYVARIVSTFDWPWELSNAVCNKSYDVFFRTMILRNPSLEGNLKFMVLLKKWVFQEIFISHLYNTMEKVSSIHIEML